MIDKYTAQASTKEAAIEKGLKALGLKREEAEIIVTEPGKKGFLGIGQKDAVVVVKRTVATNIMDEVFVTPAPRETSVKTEKESSDILSEQFIGEDKQKEAFATNEREQFKSESKATIKSGVPAYEEGTKAVDVGESDEVEAIEPVISEEEIKAKEEKDTNGIQFVADYLRDITKKMGINDVAVNVSREGKKVQYNIETEDAGLVIGRHGKVLNSLQTLAQIQLHQVAETKFFAKVDAEAYRDRRQKTVEHLAKRTADKVKRTKRPVILEPMPAHERKLIHRYLNHHQGIQTHSEGKEPHRYLVVEPTE
ncbi:RNA-binding cell elongation regulator Jag/EloR [Marinilactibacillus psychrotolerans]|uniref:RNA-binding protein KhpB n=1 Tax=Marinilactibacillus psychrotolerans TaxID=191770 RepID=A0ABW8UKM6_9LACT